MDNISKEILSSIINDYSSNFPKTMSKDTIFEYFTIENYFKDMNFSLEDIDNGLSDSNRDWGIDGFYLFIDNVLINDFDIDEYDVKSHSKGFKLDVHLFQIKNKNKVEEAVPQKFQEFAYHLFGNTDDNILPESMDEDLKKFIVFFRKLIVKMASKFPNITIHFHHVTRANKSQTSTGYIDKTKAIFDMLKQNTITKLKIEHDIVGSNELYSLAERTIPKSGNLTFNASVNVPNYIDTQAGYLVTAYLKDYYKFISTTVDEDGTRILNEEMFESNIRDYQNRTLVNKAIETTLKKSSDSIDFWWLNNGITIIANKGVTVAKTMQLDSVQIVNGLQTSNSIFNIFNNLSPEQVEADNRSVFIKVIILNDVDESRDAIIRATNSQNPVTASQLRSSDPLQRKIESFLKTKDIFYDRKKNYYRNQNKPIAKIVSINYLSQALVSILDKNPVKARSTPTILIKKDTDYNHVFNKEYDIRVFYYSLLIRMQVSKYLKNIKKTHLDDPVIGNITKYCELHVTRTLASLLLTTDNVNKDNIITIKESLIKKIPRKLLDESVTLVKKAIGDTVQDISKKTALNAKITEEINNYLNGKEPEK